MKNLKRKIGITIIILVIIAIIFAVVLYVLRKKPDQQESDELQRVDDEFEAMEITGDYEVEDIGNLPEFLSVEKCIQDNKDKEFTAKRIVFVEKDPLVNYAIYGLVGDKEKYYKLIYDINNETFSLEEQKNISNINQIDIKESTVDEIKENGKNHFEFLDMSDEDVARSYLDILKKMELEDPEQAYNILDEEYKKKRFEDLDDYKEYVKNHKEMIETGAMAKYSIEYLDEYTEVIMVDTNANSYKLRAKSAMDFKVMLDNYTIKVDGFDTSYKKSTDENKVKTNVMIFLQMINNKDYKHAYDLLDTTFRENNFGDFDKFKEYVKNNFFEYNIDTYEGNLKAEGKNFEYSTIISNNNGSAAEKKKLTIIMKLKDNTDFVMSFSLEDE